MSLNYVIRQVRDVVVLDLSGHISPNEANAARLVLHGLVRELVNTGHNKILLNLREVPNIDSSGLGELFSALTTASKQGGQLRICNANDRVGNVLRTTHLDSVLRSDKDETGSLTAFSSDDQTKRSPA